MELVAIVGYFGVSDSMFAHVNGDAFFIFHSL